MTKIDIITTTYSKNADKLKLCLSSVTERTKFVDYKWYILANTPDEKLKKIIHDSMYIDDILFNDKIEPIFNDTNDNSFSQNNNETVEEGDGEYLCFLNDDIEPLNGTWLLSMKHILDADQKVGAVGALLLYPNKTIQHCGTMFSNRTNNLPFHMHYKKPLSEVQSFISVPRYYQAVTAACMLVRRKDFEELGGFSTDFFYGFEDVSFCLDLNKKLGKRCVYTSGAQLTHHEGISGTFKKHPKIKENILALQTKHEGQYFNDEMFYLNNENYMVYKSKQGA